MFASRTALEEVLPPAKAASREDLPVFLHVLTHKDLHLHPVCSLRQWSAGDRGCLGAQSPMAGDGAARTGAQTAQRLFFGECATRGGDLITLCGRQARGAA